MTAESSQQTGQNLLNKYADLQGIFCPNESSTFGMLPALETAGKSTLMKVLSGSVRPDAGTMRLEDSDYEARNPGSRATGA